jgi:hypothetical protein
LTPRAKKRCAIITPFGVYLPTRMPFGLKTSPASFCRAIDLALSGLSFCIIYMDDIIIGATNEEEMTRNLILLFERLAQYKLKIQLDKIKFFESEIKILGVIFSKVGKKIDPAKISAILEFPEITTVKQTQSFLGMLAFLCSNIPHFSTRMFPVYQLLTLTNAAMVPKGLMLFILLIALKNMSKKTVKKLRIPHKFHVV